MSIRVAVIGSGLSAVGAIKGLLAKGIKPVVIDRGITLSEDLALKIKSLADKNPSDWSEKERCELSRNPTALKGSSIPKKLVFGSDYFYGKSLKNAPVQALGNFPPFSYALGGLSVGWGAAVLAPNQDDLGDWPFTAEELHKYCEKVLVGVPYSGQDDGLSHDFPLLSSSAVGLNLSHSSKWILDALNRTSVLKYGKLVYGQARLLVNATKGSGGCKYCGQCMSGCVYGSIYKASDEILQLYKQGKIDYLQGNLVDEIKEFEGKVTVIYFAADGVRSELIFDRVFLAAGAVNSTRIALKSLKYIGLKTRLLSRGGFVMPMLSFHKMPLQWPNSNTQPGLFMEIKGGWSKHWEHIQISTDNELLFQRLGIKNNSSHDIISRIKKWLASHIVIIFLNYHSDNAGNYDLSVHETEDPCVIALHSIQNKKYPQLKVWISSWIGLLRVFLKIGFIPLLPFAKLNSGAYHVGGTLPMKKNPKGELETDTLGRLAAWDKVHIVDSASFPSLPGTTIGLLAMANAYRVVDQIDWSE